MDGGGDRPRQVGVDRRAGELRMQEGPVDVVERDLVPDSSVG